MTDLITNYQSKVSKQAWEIDALRQQVEDSRLTAEINQKGLVDALQVALSAIDDAINAGLDLDSRTWDSLEDAGVRVRNELDQFLPYRPVGDPPY